MAEEQLIVLGGPLFRKPDTTREDFSKAWHRHAEVVLPWFLEFGITEYTQIHLHLPSASSSTVNNSEQQQSEDNDPEITQARETLCQADGVAFVKCLPLRSTSGIEQPFGDGFKHRYFSEVIANDERTFLHSESGASAVKGSTLPELPEIAGGAVTWRRIALEIGGQEYVKIKEAKQVIDDVWWDKWKQIGET